MLDASGVLCHRPMIAKPTKPATLRTPSYESSCDEKKFFAEVKDDAGEVIDRKMIKTVRAVVIVTSAYGDKIAFAKTNKGKTYFDSRTPKKRIDGDECAAELYRLLDSSSTAAQAFQALQV